MSDAVQKVDVGILAFREDELAALQASFPQEGTIDRRRRYALSRVPLEGGEAYQVAFTRVVQTTGVDDAGQTVRLLVEDVAPSVVLLVGVAATMPSDHVTLGDVVVATRAVEATRRALTLDSELRNERIHDDVARWASNLPMSSWHGEKSTGSVPGMPPEPEIESGHRTAVMASLKHHFSGPWPHARELRPHRKLRVPRPVLGGRRSDREIAGALL